jgi:hypothetical protein
MAMSSTPDGPGSISVRDRARERCRWKRGQVGQFRRRIPKRCVTGRNASSSRGQREENCPPAIPSGLSSDVRPLESSLLERCPRGTRARRGLDRRRRRKRTESWLCLYSCRRRIRCSRAPSPHRVEGGARTRADGFASSQRDAPTCSWLRVVMARGYSRACAYAKPRSRQEAAASQNRADAQARCGADASTSAIQLEASGDRSREYASTRETHDRASASDRERVAYPTAGRCSSSARHSSQWRIHSRVLLTLLGGGQQLGSGPGWEQAR